MHIFSSSFLEGCLSTLEIFQLVKLILHKVSICWWYQLIILMIGLHYVESLCFKYILLPLCLNLIGMRLIGVDSES
jgi:hypothetical protein